MGLMDMVHDCAAGYPARVEEVFFAILGASLTVIGATALRLLTLGRFHWREGPPKQVILIRIVGLIAFVFVWLGLAHWFGWWKPKRRCCSPCR